MTKWTLNQTWKYCLKMWKWIAEQVQKNNVWYIEELKQQWLQEHKFSKNLCNNCFFCDYNEQDDCSGCPGKLVTKSFDCCNHAYHFVHSPIKFYKKLLQLDKKRRHKND